MLTMRVLAGVSLALALGSPAQAKPPLEAYGDLPEVRAMALSPDGAYVGYLQRKNDVEKVMLYDLKAKKAEALATTGDFKARRLSFLSDDYLILHASVTTENLDFLTDKFEHTSAFALNLKTKKTVQLLTKADSLYPAQTGLGRILGVDPDGKHVFMPAFVMEGLRSEPPYNLLRVNLDTGVGVRAGGRVGTTSTDDWILNGEGDVVARVDWNPKTRDYSIYAYNGDSTRQIFNKNFAGKEGRLGVAAVSEDGKSLIVSDLKSNYRSLYEMSLSDGSLTGPIHGRNDADIEGVVIDRNRVARGVVYTGMFPSYEFFDKQLDRDIKGIQAKLPDSSLAVVSWSTDWSKVLLGISGGGLSERYVLFDRKARTLDLIALARPSIQPEDVGQVQTIEYTARDGLKIPALITWPTSISADARKNLPIVVLPHGGPESFDSVGFDWLSQFFANEGYLVLQPNFRGSGGFGDAFAKAGYKEWGRKMQDDVSDGLAALVKMGWADPKRACIVGWSYGGYSALAGGALTPELYKCVVALAGVSDLKRMLGDELREHGPFSNAYLYWSEVIGDPEKDSAAINSVSPINLASKYQAPVLLIHGGDDLTVPPQQSDLMEAALKRAGKEVTYLRLKGDDHGLVLGENRRRALQEMGGFVAKYISH